MREIKFRAWDQLKKRMFWVEAITFVKKTGLPKYIYYVGDKNPHSARTEVLLIEYIGLKDKNGKEIYEGDIVYRKTVTSDMFEVVYWEDGFYLKAPNGEIFGSLGAFTKGVVDSTGLKIIGNVYENPELLEKKN